MEVLFVFQDNLLRGVTNNFRRYLHRQINWKQRMIGIKGPGGAGKTTLMLQYLKYDLKMPDNALYITADHTWFYNHSLLDTAMDWYKQGGRLLLIDEVHKYPHWSRELKNIFDGIPEMQVVFSASSALDIYRGEADLSRRIISYTLPGLSFREYVSFKAGRLFEKITITDVFKNHREFSQTLLDKIQPLPLFKRYLRNGYFPIITQSEQEWLADNI